LPPPTTFSAEHRAWLAGVAEYPAWTSEPEFFLGEEWGRDGGHEMKICGQKIRGQKIRGQTGLVLYENLVPSLSVYRFFLLPFNSWRP